MSEDFFRDNGSRPVMLSQHLIKRNDDDKQRRFVTGDCCFLEGPDIVVRVLVVGKSGATVIDERADALLVVDPRNLQGPLTE